MKTLKISEETYKKIKSQLKTDDRVVKSAEDYTDLVGTDEPSKEKVVIYKTDGSVLHESGALKRCAGCPDCIGDYPATT